MLSLKRRFSAFIIASGCLLCSCVSQQKAAPVDLIDASQIKTASVKYRLASPEITDLVVTVTANGYAFLPVKERLYFKEAGPSVAILVRNNTFVSKGEVLAELTFDREEVLTNIELTQIYIDKENADHAAVNRNFDNNIATLRKQMWAETDGARRRIYALRIEQLERNCERAAEIHEETINKLTEDLEKYQSMTEPEQMLAPFDGYIDYTAAKTANDPAGAREILVEICDTSVYVLAFMAKPDDFCYNMPVKLVLKDKAKTEMDGVIVSDNTDLDSSGKRSYVIETPGTVPDLKTVMQIGFAGGFSVTADSLTVTDALVVPSAAIQTDEKKFFVNIYEDGAVKKRYVKIGAQNKDSVQILDGLTIADQVIIN